MAKGKYYEDYQNLRASLYGLIYDLDAMERATQKDTKAELSRKIYEVGMLLRAEAIGSEMKKLVHMVT